MKQDQSYFDNHTDDVTRYLRLYHIFVPDHRGEMIACNPCGIQDDGKGIEHDVCLNVAIVDEETYRDEDGQQGKGGKEEF